MIAEKNAHVEGRVIDSQKGGRVKGRAAISLELVRLHTEDGQQIEISTSTHARQAESTAKSDAKKVGIMAGIGAAVGAIAGGGKGAAIGAGVGAGAGGGTVAATRGDAVVIASETPLVFRLTESVEIVETLLASQFSGKNRSISAGGFETNETTAITTADIGTTTAIGIKPDPPML